MSVGRKQLKRCVLPLLCRSKHKHHKFLRAPRNHHRPLSQKQMSRASLVENLTSVRVWVSMETKHWIHTVCSGDLGPVIHHVVGNSWDSRFKRREEAANCYHFVLCFGQNMYTSNTTRRAAWDMWGIHAGTDFLILHMWEAERHANPHSEKPRFSCTLGPLLPSSHPPPVLLHNTT